MNGRLEADLLAVTREEAVAVLERAGLFVQVQHTGASGGLPGGCAVERVVRFCLRENTGVITVARELTRLSGDRKPFSAAGGLEK
ncbi:MAG: hypothetical protein M1130_08795 [Actinobacteria bacterium]|nr:hypothetical protein [Actinomycetota bacterium]